jgi:hypothetical protein
VIDSVAVVVPVADEAELLGGCLSALRASRERLHRERGGAVGSRVVVVLDTCTDASADIVAGFADVETIEVVARRVGVARRAGSSAALDGVADPQRVWLAATDADSRVPLDWLTGMVELADRGTDLVLGTVVPVGDHLPPAASAAYRAAYVSADGHPHVHGANLGIRASSYLRLGGWPELATGEDHALVARAVAAGDVRVRRTGGLPVATSTRLAARAPYGYSSHLRGLICATDSR